MAEIHAPENQLNGVGVVVGGGGGGGGGPLVVSTSETVGSKRQRRPSVRLGDIGDQPYDSHVRRPSTKPWKHHHHHHHHNQNQNHNHNNHNQLLANATSKPSKTKPLTNLAVTVVSGGGGEFNETLDEDKDGNNLDTVAIGSWRVKDSKKRGSAKRVRSNWVSKIDETAPGNNGDKEDKFSGAGGGGEDIEIENENDSYHRGDFDIENSEQSPIHSLENLGDGNERELLYRRSIRGSHHDGMELSGPSDNGGEDGVRIWLNSLGLGRYAPVFEIHEVDDEVLPMLTLEDLKDMGINAVGSRRKMFCAIQKLGKGFS